MKHFLENVHAGRVTQTIAGHWAHGTAPYGYRKKAIHTGSKRRYVLEIHEEEAKRVQYMVTRYIEGTSMRTIAQELTAMGVRARKTQWNRTTIRDILNRPTYRGTMAFGWSISNGKNVQAEGACPAIITPEQAVLIDSIGEHGGQNRTQEYILSGLLHCGRCGHVMCGEKSKGMPYYRCSSHTGKDRGCLMRGVRADILEQIIWDCLTDWMLNPAKLKDLAANRVAGLKDLPMDERGQVIKTHLVTASLLIVDDPKTDSRGRPSTQIKANSPRYKPMIEENLNIEFTLESPIEPQLV